MQLPQICCPRCAYRANLSVPVPVGTMVRCPGCGWQFQFGYQPPPAAPTNLAAGFQPTPNHVGMPASMYVPPKPRSSMSPWLIVGAIIGFVGLCFCGVIIIVALSWHRASSRVAQSAPRFVPPPPTKETLRPATGENTFDDPIRKIVRQLEDETASEVERSIAVSVLGVTPVQESQRAAVVRALVRFLPTVRRERFQAEVLKALAHWDQGSEREQVRPFIASANTQSRHAAIDYFLAIKDTSIAPELVEWLGNPVDRYHAEQSLRKLGRAAEPSLVKLGLAHANSEVQQQSCALLAEMGANSTEAIAALRDLARHRGGAELAARKALVRLNVPVSETSPQSNDEPNPFVRIKSPRQGADNPFTE